MHSTEDGEELFCAWGVLLMCLALAGGEPVGQCHDLHLKPKFFNRLLELSVLPVAVVPTHRGHSETPLLGHTLIHEAIAD